MTLIDPARFLLRHARIEGIGPVTLRRLEACGFRSAADFIGGRHNRTKWPNGWTVEETHALLRPDGTECDVEGLGGARLEALLWWRADVLRGELNFAGAAVPQPVSARILCGPCGRIVVLRSVPGEVRCGCGEILP